MAEFDVFRDGWYQQLMVQPEVYEVVIRVGVIPEVDHAQVQLELNDPVTGTLRGLVSWPHLEVKDLAAKLEAVVADILADLEGMDVIPVPFPSRPLVE
jgi:hypothetical protein